MCVCVCTCVCKISLHFPLRGKESEVAQSCPTLCMDCSLPGSSIHGIFQARVLEWVAISFSRRSSQQGSNPGLPHCQQMLYHLSHQGTEGYVLILGCDWRLAGT